MLRPVALVIAALLPWVARSCARCDGRWLLRIPWGLEGRRREPHPQLAVLGQDQNGDPAVVSATRMKPERGLLLTTVKGLLHDSPN